MSGRAPRRLTRQDRALIEAWSAELDDVEVPADLGGEGLELGDAVRALARVVVHRTAVEQDPGLAQVLVTALVASDAEYARLRGGRDVDPEDTELAATRRHLAALLCASRDQGYWAVGRVSVPRWVSAQLGVGGAQRRAVAAVVAALEDTADGEPDTLGAALDDHDIPALVWLLAGLVALGGRGHVSWLARLER